MDGLITPEPVTADTSEPPISLCLDLGSGPEPAPGYTGVDLACDATDGAVVMHHDLWSGEPWPFDDGSILRLRAHHVIEHIPHDRICIGQAVAKTIRKSPGGVPVVGHQIYRVTQDAFFWFFDEAYRIAAPGCRFELAWPHPLNDAADQDPTHCRRVPVSALHYLNHVGRRALRVFHYPVGCDWIVETVTVYGDETIQADETRWNKCHEIRATLVKR